MSDFTESGSQTPASPSDRLPEDDLWAELAGATARIEWAELERFFAKGQVIEVAGELDLVDVAVHVANDNGKQVDRWMQAGLFGLLVTESARDWASGERELWAVVVAPWILVQAR